MFVQPIPEISGACARDRHRKREGRFGKIHSAVHIAVALLKAGQRVATVDLGGRQKNSPITSKIVAPGVSAGVCSWNFRRIIASNGLRPVPLKLTRGLRLLGADPPSA